MEDLSFASLATLRTLLRQRQVSAVELLEAQVARIERHNPTLNAIVTLDVDTARDQARTVDAALARGQLGGPLQGIPITLKDCFATAGMRTTAGEPTLARYVPTADSTVAARLRAAGAIVLGKTNVSQGLRDYQTSNPLFGRTNNPWRHDRTPGGSSGGAAAAIAAGLTPIEVGSDIGGSIRNPAHYCRVFGLKPTDRRVPMTGHIPDLPNTPRAVRFLNGIGPLARSVEDLRLAFQIIAGPDQHDTEVVPVVPRDEPTPPLSALRIAYAPALPGVATMRAISDAIARLADDLARRGCRVEQILPPIDFRRSAELRWSLRRMITDLFAAERVTAPPLLVDFYQGLQERDDFIVAWEQFFGTRDLLLCPVSMTTAFPHWPQGSPIPVDGASVEYDDLGYCCTPFNLTGHPALVMPLASDHEGLPIGVQLVGPRWSDECLLAIAARLCELSDGFRRPPGY